MIFRRLFLFPFSLMYGCITAIHHFLYNKGILQSYTIPGKSIVIGNLSMGGTGKSPHALYLWDLLKQKGPVAFLSRGYGRKTSGLIEVQTNHTALVVGDEPLMFKKRVGEESIVVVAENRKNGVDFIREKEKEAVILLDDAFQHRGVKAVFSILLTDYNQPYFSDCMAPSGTLREWKLGRSRADCVLVTKCPENLEEQEKAQITKRLKFKNKQVFFSHIHYGKLLPFGREVSNYTTVLLVTGIAKPKPLEKHLKQFYEVETLVFPDHHQFTPSDVMKIHTKFDTFAPQNTIIVTTEKDFVRLESVLSDLDKQKYPWYTQLITVKIDREEAFIKLIDSI